MDGKSLVAVSLTPCTFNMRQGPAPVFGKKQTSKPDKNPTEEDFQDS